MESTEPAPAKLGLRERKKQQTREKIARVALELFAQQGYEHTTLAEIAEAADVAPRTIFAYYESKEDIVFCDVPTRHERLRQALEQRPASATTVDVLREWLSTMEPPDELALLRKRIIDATESLRLHEHAHSAPFEELITESIAKDLGAGPGDIRPSLIAATMRAAFTTARERLEAETGEPLSHEQSMRILDEVLEFLRGGIQALQRAPSQPDQTVPYDPDNGRGN